MLNSHNGLALNSDHHLSLSIQQFHSSSVAAFARSTVANQFGDVIWLRASILGVLVAEKLRNATG